MCHVMTFSANITGCFENRGTETTEDTENSYVKKKKRPFSVASVPLFSKNSRTIHAQPRECRGRPGVS
jgi:hypothetical protein